MTHPAFSYYKTNLQQSLWQVHGRICSAFVCFLFSKKAAVFNMLFSFFFLFYMVHIFQCKDTVSPVQNK